MVDTMRLLIIVLWFFSSAVYSQVPADFTNCTPAGDPYCQNYGAGWTTYTTGAGTCMACTENKQVCPSGYNYSFSSGSGQCFPDVPTTTGCEPGQASYLGLCRDLVDSPEDCGSTYTTAIDAGDGYVCANDGGCPQTHSPSIHNTAGGSWTVCSPSDSESSSGNTSSSGSNNSTGTDSSSGNGDGGSGGNNGGGGADNSSAANSSAPSGGGGSNSSSGGGSGGSNSSSGSGSGNGEGEGAGECDPTSSDYLNCLTQGTQELEEGEPGEFTGEGAADELANVEAEFAQAVQTIQQELQQQFGSINITGQGTLTDYCYTIMGNNVCFGWARFSSYLSPIGSAIFLVACVLSFIIVMRR